MEMEYTDAKNFVCKYPGKSKCMAEIYDSLNMDYLDYHTVMDTRRYSNLRQPEN